MDSFEDFEHFAIVLGVVLTMLGIVKGIFEIRKMVKATMIAREEAIAARTRHEDALAKMMLQFHNDHGESLLDKVEEGNREVVKVKGILDAHVKVADVWFEDNAKAHGALGAKLETQSARIDGMFEILATPLNQQRLEEVHEKEQS